MSGDVSIPTDFLPGGKGRYFNASATFDVSLENDVLVVTLAAADIQGTPVPQHVIDSLGQQNLAEDAQKDPEVAAMLRRFSSLQIDEDRIILTPRADEAPPAKPVDRNPPEPAQQPAANDP